MPYTRRRTWPDTDREDYMIRCEGLDVRPVNKSRGPHGDRFVWTIYMNGHVPQAQGYAIAGEGVELEEAAAAFKRSYEAMRTKTGLPRPQR